MDSVGKKAKVSVPFIHIPKFRYDHQGVGGIGSGGNDVGDVLSVDNGSSGAGKSPGKHVPELELSIDEMLEILGEELELPNLTPKENPLVKTSGDVYDSISRVGPDSMRHFRRGLLEALKRQIITGSYNPVIPKIVPIREDMRYRSWKEQYVPDTKAVIINIRDVSGSMTTYKKEIVRIISFWLNAWIKKYYNE